MTDSLSYLYAVGEAALADATDLPTLRGVDDASVRAVVEGDLTAVVSPVSRTRFNEKSLRAALEDLRWLENTARAHHGVVDALAAAHPVAPVRLATIYHDEDNVRALLADRAPELSTALSRLRGRAEWGVKAFAVPADEHSPADPAEEPAGAGPGTSYLLRRRAQRDRSARHREHATEAAERAYRELGRHAVASRRYPPQDPRLTGRHDEMLLNAAYLVPETLAGALRRLVEGWADPHLRLELTGPWAAYSFATVERE